jgi:hypothetical protein
LDIIGPATESGSSPAHTPGSIILGLEFLSSLTPSSWPLVSIFSRPFSAAEVRAERLALSPGRGLIVSANLVIASNLAPDSTSLSVKGLTLSWPEAAASADDNARPGGDRSGEAEPKGTAEAGFESDPGPFLLSEAGLNPLTADFSLRSSFDAKAGRWSMTVTDLEMAEGLGSAALAVEIANLTPAAMDSLAGLSPSTASRAALDPALYDTGLSRLAVDFTDKGLGRRLAEAERLRLGLSEAEAPSRMADALEMLLTIRLDPVLANIGELSEALRRYLENPAFLAVRAHPDPPLSPVRLSALAPLRGPGLFETAPTLQISLSVNLASPVDLVFRPEGAFDVDYTGDDAALHPKPRGPHGSAPEAF